MGYFNNSLQDTLDSIPNRDVKIIMCDFNAKVGKLRNNKPSCGKFGLCDQNEGGTDSVEFCQSNNLSIANTIFEHHPRHFYTWKSPDKKTRNQINCITIDQKWKGALKTAKTRLQEHFFYCYSLNSVGKRPFVIYDETISTINCCSKKENLSSIPGSILESMQLVRHRCTPQKICGTPMSLQTAICTQGSA